MLYTYRQELQLLLNDLKVEMFAPIFLTGFINRARTFVAGESQSVRVLATATMAAGTQTLSFLNIPVSGVSVGASTVLNVRMVGYSVASGMRYLQPRPWEWFFLYGMNNPNPQSTAYPTMWSQYGQGVNGLISVNPTPQSDLLLTLDTVCLPTILIDDSTPEAIPEPYTECVPFWAAWYAYMMAQQKEEAESMMSRYKDLMDRCNKMIAPEVNQTIYPLVPDPVMMNTLALKAGQ
jgi:hypothetical protein